MTLAETASIFCETVIRRAGLEATTGTEQLAILEASLQGACQIVVDISSRFLFEQNVFEKRRDRDLSVQELNALMVDAQEQTYGDGLDPDLRHKYMWAMKPHYYSYGSFYNYPYMFGMLFGLGLYACYQGDPEAFKARYDDLLASTGSADAAALGARFGIDIRAKEFWQASLAIVVEDIDRFEALAAGPWAGR
jgi:oligoendopeptidase F